MQPSLSTDMSHKQLRGLVADQLRAAILEGVYKPGEWLRQEKIAQELGVSQMPVREAIKELTAEGLIEHIPYRGARVIEFSVQDIDDLYAHRAFLEGFAARIAAENITAEEIDQLKHLQTQIEENLEPDQLSTYRQLNREFHGTIFRASRRAYLVRSLDQMWAAFPTMLIGNFAGTADRPLPQRDTTDMEEHHAIIAAMENHDPQAAEQAMRAHILATKQYLVASLQDND